MTMRCMLCTLAVVAVCANVAQGAPPEDAEDLDAERVPGPNEYWLECWYEPGREAPSVLRFPWKESDVDHAYAAYSVAHGGAGLVLMLDTSKNQRDLHQWAADAPSIPSIRFAERQLGLGLRDVFPFEGHLYVWTGYTTDSQGAVDYRVLERITPLLPENVRPVAGARQLCLHEKPSWLFWNPVARDAGLVQVMEIERTRRSDDVVAQVHVEPPAYKREDRATPGFYVHDPYDVTLRTGDIFACDYQGYRVLNIVEPQDVELEDGRTVHLIGWIELDPEPLPPPSDPAVAPEEE